MNHYHEVAIAEDIRKVENACYEASVNVAMSRYIRLWKIVVPDPKWWKFTYYHLLDQCAEDKAFLRKYPLPPEDLSTRQRYHAINNECERLVG